MSSEWVYVKPPQRIEFFGEVKHRLVSPTEREVEVVVKPDESLGFELAIAALALDGSKSMLRTYAAHLPKMIRRKQNKVHPVAQELASFLAKNSSNQCASQLHIPSVRWPFRPSVEAWNRHGHPSARSHEM